VLIEILLYTTTLKIIYLIINLLETLNHPIIILIIKLRHLLVGRRNNYSFPILYRNRYFIYLLKYLIRLILTKIITIRSAIYKRIRKYTLITLRD